MHKTASLSPVVTSNIPDASRFGNPLPSVETSAVTPVGLTRKTNLKYSFIYRWRSVICSIIVFSTWGVGIFSTPYIQMGSWAERILTACGWACFATGVFLRFWATLYIGGRKSTAVICEGPYSITRNPLYWGTLMVILAQGFFYHNLVFALGLIPPMLIYYFGVIPAEERHLRAKLGEEYLAYCDLVPRIGPKFSRYRSAKEIVVSMKGLRAEAVRILGWIWLPILAQVINALRYSPSWPHPFNLP